MTTISKQLQEKAQAEGKTRLPFLELATQIMDEAGKKKGVQGTGEHRVKFLRDKMVKGKEYGTGEERDEVEYLFLEDGTQKKYCKPTKDRNGNLHYFVAEMAKYNYGDELILEYKKKQGSYEGYIDIDRASEPTAKVSDEEIPIIEDDEPQLRKVVPTAEGEEIDIDEIPF